MRIKKGKYRFVGRRKISLKYIYQKYDPCWQHLIYKYFRDTSLLFSNSPICDCARDCIRYGNKIIEMIDDLVLVKYNVEMYIEAGELKKQNVNRYKLDLVKRLLGVVVSIKKHGYAIGKYKNKFVCVIESGPEKYEIISGKHRAAAVVALGKKKMICDVYREIR